MFCLDKTVKYVDFLYTYYKNYTQYRGVYILHIISMWNKISTHICVRLCLSPLTLTYKNSGLTQSARLLGSVQGVVVQAIKATSSLSTNGKLTITDGSWTSWRQKWNKIKSMRCYMQMEHTVVLTSIALEQWRCERAVISYNLVVLVGLKVGQGGVAGGGERHDFDTSVNQTLVVQLFEHPPEWIRHIQILWEGRKDKLHTRGQICHMDEV